MTLGERSYTRSVIRLRWEFPTGPGSGAPTSLDQVTQNLDANKAMLTAIAGPDIVSHLRGALSTRTAETT